MVVHAAIAGDGDVGGLDKLGEQIEMDVAAVQLRAAAEGAWFVKLKNNIVAIHGSDFAGTEKAVKAFRARYVTPAKGARDLAWDAIDMREGPQPDDVFEAERAKYKSEKEADKAAKAHLHPCNTVHPA